ncbi:MAG TPA: esterase-like activity of phytase family protein, partial [Brevundimonas sp.]|nr:esterase-like activity of phytase family protein [Brevundimonas sp.]
MKRLAASAAASVLFLSGCATVVPASGWSGGQPGWTAASAGVRPVGLGVPGGAMLAEGVTFAGGLQLVLEPESPLHSLSDLKLIDEDDFVAVTDTGDLVRGRLRLDGGGRLRGADSLRYRRLKSIDGAPITDKAEGDAEGLFLTPNGDLVVSFERLHRLWSYGPLDGVVNRPGPLPSPDAVFPLNDGMEG